MSQLSSLKPRAAAIGEDAGGHPLSSLVRAAERWLCRRQARQELTALSDAQLKDIGVSREEAVWEARKPFWRA